MANTIKDKVADAGQAVVDTAKSVGQAVAVGASKAAGFVAENTGLGFGPKEGTDAGVTAVRERMDVIASCGKKVGVVDHVEGGAIKLTRKDSPDDTHHFIPLGWVDHVDSHVHLTKNSKEAELGWKSDASSCGCA